MALKTISKVSATSTLKTESCHDNDKTTTHSANFIRFVVSHDKVDIIEILGFHSKLIIFYSIVVHMFTGEKDNAF